MTADEAKAYFGDLTQATGVGVLMSNYNRKVDKEVEKLLKETPYGVAEYPGWDFYSQVFYKDEKFHACVMRHHQFIEMMSAPTPEELMKAVSDKYGWD